MLDTSFTSIPCAALLAGLLCLTGCGSTGNVTDGDSTDPTTDPTTETTTESAPTTGTVPTTTTTTMETTTDPSDGTDTATAGACDHEVVDACCCFELDPGGEFEMAEVKLGCGDSPLCPSVAISCHDPDEPYGSWGPCASTDDEAALGCALEALAAGEPGSLQIAFSGGISSETLRYYVQGDGTAILHREGLSDSYPWIDAVEHRTLKPASFFTDCLSADSVEPKATCLRDALTGEALEQCTEPAK